MKSYESRLLSFLIVSALLVGLASCSIPPVSRAHDRDRALVAATRQVGQRKEEALYALVRKAGKKAQETGDVGDYIDYYYLKSASTKIILGKVRALLADKQQKEALPFIEEGLKIAPDNVELREILGQLSGSDREYAYDDLSPTSRSGRVINRMFERRLMFSQGVRFHETKSLDDFSPDDYTDFGDIAHVLRTKLSDFEGFVADVDQSIATVQETDAAHSQDMSLRHHFQSFEYDWNRPGAVFDRKLLLSLARSVREKTGLPFLFGQGVTEMIEANSFAIDTQKTLVDLVRDFAGSFGVNTVVGPFGILVYQGASIPAYFDNGKRSFSLMARYRDVNAILNGLRANGFSRNVTGVDSGSGTIWFNGTIGEYLRCLEYVQSIDNPVPEVLLHVEIFEIEDSLLEKIGVRVPQEIGLNFADPTYRKYSFSDAAGGAIGRVDDNGIIVNHNTSGTISIANLIAQSRKDVVRAVIVDQAFGYAAREQNYRLSILERPMLRLRQGVPGSIDVGSKIPVITATATSSGFVSEQVTYVNSGVQIQARLASLNDNRMNVELTIKTSNLVKTIVSPSGSSAPQLSSREVVSSLGLVNGETVLIGGISSLNSSENLDGLPGLAGNRFTNWLGGTSSRSNIRTELMMLITPEIIIREATPSRNWIGVDAGTTSVSGAEVIAAPQISSRREASAASAPANSPAVDPQGREPTGRRN